MIDKIDIRIKWPDGYGIIHDSRSDTRTLAYVSNLQRSKINELVDVVNDLTAVVNILSAKIEELEYGRL